MLFLSMVQAGKGPQADDGLSYAAPPPGEAHSLQLNPVNPDTPGPEKLVVPEDKDLARPCSYPEVEHGHAGGIHAALVPPVEDFLDVVLFPAQHKRNRFLRTLVFVSGRDLYSFKFHGQKFL